MTHQSTFFLSPFDHADVKGRCYMDVRTSVAIELDALGALDTVEGATALALAERLGDKNSVSPSSTAKQLLAIIDDLRARTPKAKTVLDELRAKREKRAAR